MSLIEYHAMSLFDAPEGAGIMHACNAQGVWRSGIAAEFATRYPDAYAEYRKRCAVGARMDLPLTGKCFAISDDPHTVICLITSQNYGIKVDPPEQILVQTTLALEKLFDVYPPIEGYRARPPADLWCCKFNSGLFRVPWERTEAILEVFAQRYNVRFNVCDPNLRGV